MRLSGFNVSFIPPCVDKVMSDIDHEGSELFEHANWRNAPLALLGRCLTVVQSLLGRWSTVVRPLLGRLLGSTPCISALMFENKGNPRSVDAIANSIDTPARSHSAPGLHPGSQLPVSKPHLTHLYPTSVRIRVWRYCTIPLDALTTNRKKTLRRQFFDC